MRRGFTLLEVVVALLVLEVAVVGVVGALVLASSTLARAEAVEHQVAVTEGLLDSLARSAAAGADSVRNPLGRVSWVVDDSGHITLRAMDARDDTIVALEATMPPW